jgi:acetyl-CoA carboxylase carboxyl transferase beta subunit
MSRVVKSEFKKNNILIDDIWIRCDACKEHILKEIWYDNINVCPQCNFHDKITPQQRIEIVIDPGTFQHFNDSITPSDPLGFVDGKASYRDKIDSAKGHTKQNESVVTGIGEIYGIKVVVAIMDFRFLGGSLGSATGEKILQASNLSYNHRIPYIVFSASSGARMQEGVLSLMQMAKTCAGIARLNEKKIPYISILTHPTTGGVSASFAMVGDINIAEPGALIGFAGKRVIEQTINQTLPPDFQTAEFVQKHGFIDLIVERRHIKDTLKQILSYYNYAGVRKNIHPRIRHLLSVYN